MEIKPISTALWSPRNLTPSILERKTEKIIQENSLVPKKRDYLPKYIPVEKIRKITNSINYLV